MLRLPDTIFLVSFYFDIVYSWTSANSHLPLFSRWPLRRRSTVYLKCFMYFALCRVTGFFFITRTTLLVCSQLWIHSCMRRKQWTVNLGCGYPSNPTQIYPHHCYNPLSKLSPTRQRYLRNLNVLVQYSNILIYPSLQWFRIFPSYISAA